MKLTIALTSLVLAVSNVVFAQGAPQPAEALAKAEPKVIECTPDEIQKQIAAGVTVIDVRTEDEFEHVHIKGAKNLNMLDSDFEKNVAALDPKKPIIVHCAAGSRSSRAIREVFSKSGIQTIYHLSTGISGWQKAGKPVEKTPTPAQSNQLPDRLK
jgi:rhodanese-related sulfurtransferase